MQDNNKYSTSEHFLNRISNYYKTLFLPVEHGINNTKTYKQAAYGFKTIEEIETLAKSENIKLNLDFSFSTKDFYKVYNTPAGKIDVLYFFERNDFIRTINVLHDQCEPVNYPETMNSIFISQIYNWIKINKYIDNSPIKFLGINEIKSNIKAYLKPLIIVTHGPYSNVSADEVGIQQKEWLEKSLNIRIYHELCHFIREKLGYCSKDSILEEVIADMCGLIYAFGKYDKNLAKLILGVNGAEYKAGSRLENYVLDNIDIQKTVSKAIKYIDKFSCIIKNLNNKDPLWTSLIKL